RSSKLKKTKVPGVWHDGTGRFLVRARWRDAKTGKRMKREAVARTFEEAVVLQQTLKDVVDARTTRMRFADYAGEWLKGRAHELAPSTRERYVAELARIVTVLGDHFVDAIEEGDVRKWRDELAKHVSAGTVNAHHRTLRVALEPLARKGVLRRNPARDVA